ncbi:adenosine deaminase [Pseudoalteromonas sp. Of7M-16]|uniref:adenosine deaminase n=1 Tax=Pseudoalteromonas sp. Of7M-16 TaxID=2917756 RepID=UPI001EF6B3AC|nr:adenosine deaminase [Pseudoalteromonas sp. Of7M-16]MCG7551075.1 adenosine deaminase [Pseudoalteromonas sp. Of7M-16]
MKKVTLTLAALSIATLSGCASIMTHEEQTIDITTSNHKAVEVTVEGNKVTTPGTVVVLRDGKSKVINTTDSSCEQQTEVKKSVTPVFFGNIIIGGLLGSTTDSVTGKMWDYDDSVEIKCN